ncbi:MAG TPA: hypothetical protein VGI23_14215, partial [Steroidobacteraceae bacterium]
MSLRSIVLAGLCMLPILSSAKPPEHSPTRAVQTIPDRHALSEHLRSLGYKVRGGVDHGATARDEARGGSFPHFTSSFTV